MRRETSDIQTNFTADGAMAVALEFEANRRKFDDTMKERAGLIIEQLGQAGFQVVSNGSIENLQATLRTVELGLKLERERLKLARERDTVVEEAIAPGAVATEDRPLTDREISDVLTPGYLKALHLVRSGQAWPGAITKALGGDPSNGPEGDVWALYSEMTRAREAASEPDDEPGDEAEKDDWGLSYQGADDLAQRYGCRCEISGKDDPAQPDTYYDDLTAYAVVTDRSNGRLVGLVECWDSEDGDPLVPRTWLKAVLVAWRAKATPKRAA